MLRTLARQCIQKAEQDLPFYLRNPYKAKKAWPPDFDQLSSKLQFRLERKYRRRCKLKYQPESWIKGVQIAQLSTVLAITVYAVLFMDWKIEKQPFGRIRSWFWGLSEGFWSKDQIRRKNGPEDASPVASSGK